jgi:predicted dehydrogenase
MDRVRFGIIGLGGMGSHHARYINSVDGAQLTAICDIEPAAVEKAGRGLEVARYGRYQDLINSGKVDAVLIATPHYQHCEIACMGFEKGLHILSEKPQAVSINDARRTNAFYEAYKDRLKYGIVYQMRTNPLFAKLRDLVQGGELGRLTRITWIATRWFRTWAYYASGGWRATWAGEGGGVMINQCPHNLDQLWWITGLMPCRITAVGSIGKTHPIEVDDEMSAILEYPDGAIGHFITTTGEAPGTDRLEICGDRGKLVAENGAVRFHRTRGSVSEIRRTSRESFAQVETWEIDIPLGNAIPEGHKFITQNFVNAILKGEPQLAPGVEGVFGLEIGNGMLMSGLTGKPVDLPLDGAAYDAFIEEMKRRHGGKKQLQTRAAKVDMGASF